MKVYIYIYENIELVQGRVFSVWKIKRIRLKNVGHIFHSDEDEQLQEYISNRISVLSIYDISKSRIFVKNIVYDRHVDTKQRLWEMTWLELLRRLNCVH